MNKQNKKRLQELEIEASRKRSPNFPEYARVKTNYSDKKANGLTKCILDWMKFSGHHAERINTMGVPVDKRKIVTDVIGRQRQIGSMTWRKGGGTKGSADVQGVIQGRIFYFEVKIGNDKQSEPQIEFQKQVESAGAKYFIVRNFDQFIEIYEQIISEIP